MYANLCRVFSTVPGNTIKSINAINNINNSWLSFTVQLVKNTPVMQETQFDSWVGKIPWRRDRLMIPVFWPGEFHGLHSPWAHKESDTTEQLSL